MNPTFTVPKSCEDRSAAASERSAGGVAWDGVGWRGMAWEGVVRVAHLRLPDAVHARHRLHVDLRVPVRVEEDARVGGLAVDAEASRARGHEEDELGRYRVTARARVRARVRFSSAEA